MRVLQTRSLDHFLIHFPIVAGRTTIHSATVLEHVPFDRDFWVLLIETSYQLIISFFRITETAKKITLFKDLIDYVSAIAIGIGTGSTPEDRDFVHAKFCNFIHTEGFETYNVFWSLW